jgi:lysophospholipase L1-like esterase
MLTSTCRWLARAALLAVLLHAAGCGGGGGGSAPGPQVQPATTGTGPLITDALQTTWTAAMQDYNESLPGVVPAPPPAFFQDQTIRQTMRVSVGGHAVRVLVSNLYGTQPLTLAGIHIARHAGGTAIDPATDTPLTFQGRDEVTVPAGGQAWSDEVRFALAARSGLTVSIHVGSARQQAATWHAGAFQRGGVAAGNALSSADLAGAQPLQSTHWVSRIDVRTARAGGVLVAFGDSLTEGALSSVDANRRYPDMLDGRIGASPAALAVNGVVNAGLGGNRVLNDGFGLRGTERFERDVVQVTNARAAVILLGINDIHAPAAGVGPEVSAAQIIDGLTRIVLRGREAGLVMLLATLPPCKGAAYFTESGEAKRQAVNGWIRTQALAQGVVDLDAALRDAADAQRLAAAYDSGDALHPNDTGMAAIANAFDLALLSAGP